MKPNWIVIGCIFAAVTVALGAFGAHMLQDRMIELYPNEELRNDRIDNWETATRYAMYHALGIIALGVLQLQNHRRLADIAGWLLLVGALIFSGCLYLLTLTNLEFLGAIVPIGGVLQLAGWVTFAIGSWRKKHGT